MIKTLHALRFVFIMLIVVSHIVGSSFDFGGDCGVSFFFVLSGFVLSLAYGDSIERGQFKPSAFISRQLSKFYPLHLLTLVAFVLLDIRLGHYYDWQHLMPSILLVQSWIPDDEYFFAANGSSWFLCDILFFYLLFRLAYLWLRRMPLIRLGILAIVVSIVYLTFAFMIPLECVNSILYVAPWTRLLDFCLGILLCRFYDSDKGRQWAKALSGRNATPWELLSIVLLVSSFYAYGLLTPRLRCVALFWLVIPPFLLFYSYADKGHGRVTRCLQHPLLQWLGGISFEIYLVHMLVLRIVNSVCLSIGASGEWLSALCELVLLIPVAWLTKRFFVDKIYVSLIKYVV